MEHKDRFSVQTRDDGVFLVVVAAETGDLPLEVGSVLDALALAKIADYNRAAVDDEVRAMNGTPVKIAEAQKPRPVASIKVLVSRDRMEAFLQIEIPDGAIRPEPDEVLDRMAKSGVVSGIVSEGIDLACANPISAWFAPKESCRKMAPMRKSNIWWI